MRSYEFCPRAVEVDLYVDARSTPMVREDGPRCATCRTRLQRTWAGRHRHCVPCLNVLEPDWYAQEAALLRRKVHG